MARGYAEGPATEERLEALERGRRRQAEPPTRHAVYGSTAEQLERHFIGWLDEVDPDELFASGQAWGLSIVRRPAPPGATSHS
jgi:hypothetical protein